jgi:hypothetical protein
MDKNFADIDEKSTGKSKFVKIEYLRLEPGQYTVRILEEQATKKYAHFVNFSSVECLGKECPVCANNKRTLYEHPEDYREVKGWSPKRERFWVNVLDKTGETPVVKVLSGGPNLFDDFKLMSRATRTDGDDVVDIRAYDWTLMVSGSGRDREVTPVPQYRGKNDPISLEGLELFDLSNCLPNITAEEMVDFINGASLKDIFTLRRATSEVLEKTSDSSSDLEKEIQASVDAIFKA